MTKNMVVIDKFTGLDLNNDEVHHVKVTPFYLDGTIYRLGVYFLPEATDQEVVRKFRRHWREMVERWIF